MSAVVYAFLFKHEIFCNRKYLLKTLVVFADGCYFEFADVAVDDDKLTERVTVTRQFKDKVIQPILKVS